MFINSRKLVVSVNRLAKNNLAYYNPTVGAVAAAKQIHTTSVKPNYAATEILPLPNNIDSAETTRFSPNRSRDISANVILCSVASPSTIDITADNTTVGNVTAIGQDPHVQSYDCFGAVSLNSSMQSNVPTPFGGMHGFSHLNMPGGQWSQEGKFMSQNLNDSHYRALRDATRATWVAYDQDATIDKKDNRLNVRNCLQLIHKNNNNISSWNGFYQSKRNYCSSKAKLNADAEQPKAAQQEQQQQQAQITPNILTKREKLRKAFAEYGITIVVFHVAISLASLGGFYLLISSGIDLMPVLDYLGLASTSLSNRIATGASTFVVAYAVHKLFAPVRISITLGAAPFIVRYLRSKGILKTKPK